MRRFAIRSVDGRDLEYSWVDYDSSHSGSHQKMCFWPSSWPLEAAKKWVDDINRHNLAVFPQRWAVFSVSPKARKQDQIYPGIESEVRTVRWSDSHYHAIAKLLKAAYSHDVSLRNDTVGRIQEDFSAMFLDDNPSFSPLAFGNRCNPFLDYYENPNRNDYGVMSADYKHRNVTCESPLPCPHCDPTVETSILIVGQTVEVDRMGE